MGAFLDTPMTNKDTSVVRGNGIAAGASAMQGWRVDMEDEHSMFVDIPDAPGFSWFAVFDGHGGNLTSATAARHLLDKVKATDHFKRDLGNVENLEAAIRQGFMDVDVFMRTQAHGTPAEGIDRSGSTAIAALITPTHIIVGNCGDSRAILVRDGKVVEMSQDHKPYNVAEQKRIENAGGNVTMRRVNGDLAVSRALGDFGFKHMTALKPEEQQVSPEPEIKTVLRAASQDQYLVLACDGIWDVMTNEDVADFIVSKAKEGMRHCGELAGALLDLCLEKGSRDNMSAVVVDLSPPAGDQSESTATASAAASSDTSPASDETPATSVVANSGDEGMQIG